METDQNMMAIAGPALYLRERAESYWNDSVALLETGDVPMSVAYRAIAEELRRCADEITGCRCGCHTSYPGFHGEGVCQCGRSSVEANRG